MIRASVIKILIAIITFLLFWDITLATDEKKNNTISEIIQESSHKHPLLSFMLGLLIGHWLWD